MHLQNEPTMKIPSETMYFTFGENLTELKAIFPQKYLLVNFSSSRYYIKNNLTNIHGIY